MQTPLRQQRLAALRNIIADIERKPALAEARAKVEAEGGRFPILAGGLLQEVFTDDRRNAGASLGFALAQSRSLLTPQRLAVVYVQLTQEAQQLGLPYGPGLLHFGFDPDALVMVRAGSMAELLWVAEEALGCRAVAAVVGDIGKPSKVLDFTASRRLSLRAAEAGSSMFLLRYGTGRESSAAQLRWHLTPRHSGRRPFDDRAPGPARWHVRLERGSLLKQHAEWVLGWTENGFASFTPRPRLNRGAPAPVHGAVPAQLGNRLSQTG